MRQGSGSTFMGGGGSGTLAASKRNKSHNIQFYLQKDISMSQYARGTELLHRKMLCLHIAISFQNAGF